MTQPILLISDRLFTAVPIGNLQRFTKGRGFIGRAFSIFDSLLV